MSVAYEASQSETGRKRSLLLSMAGKVHVKSAKNAMF
jgi:hypothetical protein